MRDDVLGQAVKDGQSGRSLVAFERTLDGLEKKSFESKSVSLRTHSHTRERGKGAHPDEQ